MVVLKTSLDEHKAKAQAKVAILRSSLSAVAPYVLSDWERTTYYNGISPDHPELLYHSDLFENPFPIPKGRHLHLPTKTLGRFATQPSRQLVSSSTARTGRTLLVPVVVWIATHPTTTTADNAHDASPGILAILKANGVEGAVVEWYEGAVEKLSGPPLLRVTDDTNPTNYARRILTSALGMPIATAEEVTDAQGNVKVFFHENKDKHGAPSAKVFGVSNCHVLREDTTVRYEFKGAGAPPQHRGLDEIKACVGGYGTDADLLTREIVELEAKPKSEDPDEAAMEAMREKLAKVKKDIGVLEASYKDTNTQWGDIAHRNIGHVDWAPKISVDVQGRKYTKDIGTFEVDPARFKAQFKGNFTSRQLTDMFYAQSAGRAVFKFPTNRQLRIDGCVTRELLAVPNCFDGNGEPCLVVMKGGNATDLTVGRYAGLEAYLCDDLGVESIELASKTTISRSMVGILHSGMPKGGTNHVTYATPVWWAIEQLKPKYPHTDFNRTAF
ncbi:hypothetical protein EDB87DRAFT_1777302 [Lactarius vividus]|nr:hypothetical protein EDB87DRAFT_1777302 [Lactarius vividus]